MAVIILINGLFWFSLLFVGFITIGDEVMCSLTHPQHPCQLPWASETRSGKEHLATVGELLR
jgi:hypothetical protein